MYIPYNNSIFSPNNNFFFNFTYLLIRQKSETSGSLLAEQEAFVLSTVPRQNYLKQYLKKKYEGSDQTLNTFGPLFESLKYATHLQDFAQPLNTLQTVRVSKPQTSSRFFFAGFSLKKKLKSLQELYKRSKLSHPYGPIVSYSTKLRSFLRIKAGRVHKFSYMGPVIGFIEQPSTFWKARYVNKDWSSQISAEFRSLNSQFDMMNFIINKMPRKPIYGYQNYHLKSYEDKLAFAKKCIYAFLFIKRRAFYRRIVAVHLYKKRGALRSYANRLRARFSFKRFVFATNKNKNFPTTARVAFKRYKKFFFFRYRPHFQKFALFPRERKRTKNISNTRPNHKKLSVKAFTKKVFSKKSKTSIVLNNLKTRLKKILPFSRISFFFKQMSSKFQKRQGASNKFKHNKRFAFQTPYRKKFRNLRTPNNKVSHFARSSRKHKNIFQRNLLASKNFFSSNEKSNVQPVSTGSVRGSSRFFSSKKLEDNVKNPLRSQKHTVLKNPADATSSNTKNVLDSTSSGNFSPKRKHTKNSLYYKNKKRKNRGSNSNYKDGNVSPSQQSSNKQGGQHSATTSFWDIKHDITTIKPFVLPASSNYAGSGPSLDKATSLLRETDYERKKRHLRWITPRSEPLDLTRLQNLKGEVMVERLYGDPQVMQRDKLPLDTPRVSFSPRFNRAFSYYNPRKRFSRGILPDLDAKYLTRWNQTHHFLKLYFSHGDFFVSFQQTKLFRNLIQSRKQIKTESLRCQQLKNTKFKLILLRKKMKRCTKNISLSRVKLFYRASTKYNVTTKFTRQFKKLQKTKSRDFNILSKISGFQRWIFFKQRKSLSALKRRSRILQQRPKFLWPFRRQTKQSYFKRWKASRFYYRVVEPHKFKRKNRRWRFIQYSHNRVAKLRMYYTTTTQNQFKHLLSAVSSIGKKSLHRFLMLLEGRLEFFLTRINFAPSKYFVKQILRNNGVLVSNKVINSKSYVLKPFEVLSISSEQFSFIFFSIVDRLLRGKIVLNYPSYVEVDYVLLQAVFIKYPGPADIILPFAFEYDLSNRNLHYIYNRI